MITRLVLFHESGIPIFSWPMDDSTTSVFTSFISALQQFVTTYFSQGISLVGLEKENIILKRNGSYMLAISFVDPSCMQLINNIANEFLDNLKERLEKSDVDEIQINREEFNLDVMIALEASGFNWLLKVTEYVYNTPTIVGVSIFQQEKGNTKPLYMPLEPVIGFNKLVDAISSLPRIRNIIQASLGKPTKINIIAKNGKGLEYWIGKKYIALMEHVYENNIPTVSNAEIVIPEQGSKRILYNIFVSFALNILEDQPELVTIWSSKTNKAYVINYSKAIMGLQTKRTVQPSEVIMR